jgi:hypothetical protein
MNPNALGASNFDKVCQSVIVIAVYAVLLKKEHSVSSFFGKSTKCLLFKKGLQSTRGPDADCREKICSSVEPNEDLSENKRAEIRNG